MIAKVLLLFLVLSLGLGIARTLAFETATSLRVLDALVVWELSMRSVVGNSR